VRFYYGFSQFEAFQNQRFVHFKKLFHVVLVGASIVGLFSLRICCTLRQTHTQLKRWEFVNALNANFKTDSVLQ